MTIPIRPPSLARFLATPAGHRTVAAFVGVRKTDPAMLAQAEETAAHFAPRRDARTWTLADLRKAALRVDAAGVYHAKEGV